MKIGILECGHTMPEVEQKHGTFPQMFARLLEGHESLSHPSKSSFAAPMRSEFQWLAFALDIK